MCTWQNDACHEYVILRARGLSCEMHVYVSMYAETVVDARRDADGAAVHQARRERRHNIT